MPNILIYAVSQLESNSNPEFDLEEERGMSLTTSRMTAEELFLMPNDGAGYELVRGELKRKRDPHKMSPAGFKHGTIVARLTGALEQHIEAIELGIVAGFKYNVAKLFAGKR